MKLKFIYISISSYVFLVSDTSASRESRIQSLLIDKPPLAAILAVIHFEWTIRRAIIASGTSPNVIIREKLEGCHGHKKYKQLWQEEVYPQANKRLTEIIKDWQGLQKSFQLRHKLVHGVKSCGKSEYANNRVLWALNAAKDIREFVTSIKQSILILVYQYAVARCMVQNHLTINY